MEHEIKEFYRNGGKGTILYNPETFVLTVINEAGGQLASIEVGPCVMLDIAGKMTRVASEIFEEEKR